MGEAAFDVTPDFTAQLLSIRMRGFWDDATMAAYLKAVNAAAAMLHRAGGCKFILVNMSGYPIQTRHIAEGHGALLRSSRKMPGTRVALVMQSALSKLQASRLAADSGHEIFPSEEAAMDWLMAEVV